MNLAAIYMIRNEQDILNVFINHVDALFDTVYLIDHRSIDSSEEILRSAVRQREGWTYIKLETNGHYQKETTTFAMRQLFKQGADCVFFLDCDEFIQIKNREKLEKIVVVLNNSRTVGSFRWINCVPDFLDRLQFNYNSVFWKSRELSQHSKVLIPKSVYDQYMGELFLSQGNHLVIDSGGKVLDTLEIGHLIHLPVRSRRQLIRKAILSELANISRSTRKPGEGFQFKEMLRTFANGEPRDDMVRGCVNLYQSTSKIIPITKMDLTNGMYQKTSLKKLGIASTHKFSFEINPVDTNFIERAVADQILSWEDEDSGNLVYDEKGGRIFIKK